MEIDGLELIGRGRSSRVYALGDGTVLRRHHRSDYDATGEAAAMRRAAEAGVPVPVVHAVDGPDLVMDRVDGPTLMEQLIRDAVSPTAAGTILAELHRALDATVTTGAGLVHGDLHPGNVIMTGTGPSLIDWTNQRVGDRGLDVAISWILLGCFSPDEPAVQTVLDDHRRSLVDALLAGTDRPAAVAALPAAVALRRDDPHTSDAERAAMDRLLRDHTA